MLDLYRNCAKAFGWSIKDCDESDFETLMLFWLTEASAPTQKTINGQVYKLASRAPSFL
jgi:hypothetical protein